MADQRASTTVEVPTEEEKITLQKILAEVREAKKEAKDGIKEVKAELAPINKKLEGLETEVSELRSEMREMRSLSQLQVDSARANTQMRGNMNGGFDMHARPPGDAFVEPQAAWTPRSPYETD